MLTNYNCIAIVYTKMYNIFRKKVDNMASKTANLYIRIEPDVKEKAEIILSKLGISSSNAINMFYNQIILQNGLPFDVKIPNEPLCVDKLSKEEFEEEINKGIRDMNEGNVKSSKEVFDSIKKDYNL